MPVSASFHVDCLTRSAAESRAWLRTVLAVALPAGVRYDLIDDAVLCASELISNAVEAGCASATLSMCVADGVMRLSVIDDAQGHPLMSEPLATAARGRGLVLVDALSSRWGVDPAAVGKEVWAELALI